MTKYVIISENGEYFHHLTRSEQGYVLIPNLAFAAHFSSRESANKIAKSFPELKVTNIRSVRK